MPSTFRDAFAPIADLVGARCSLHGLLRPDGEPPPEVLIFDWSALSEGERGELIVDFLGDPFADPEAGFLALPEDGRAPPRWRPEALIPFALVGPAGLSERGATWNLAGPVDSILFLDLAAASAGGCPVVAWQGGATPELLEVAASVAALDLRPAG
jgi:hypothetical protein